MSTSASRQIPFSPERVPSAGSDYDLPLTNVAAKPTLSKSLGSHGQPLQLYEVDFGSERMTLQCSELKLIRTRSSIEVCTQRDRLWKAYEKALNST
jgi:hypothetical protein